MHLGFNTWEVAPQEAGLAPTCLWRSEGVDWWSTAQAFEVPAEAFDLAFAFTDGHGAWDNNDGHNFSVPVTQSRKAAAAPPRQIASTETVDHAGGQLHIITLAKRAVTDRTTKEARWTEEKVLRVWTPPGYSREGAPPGGWPVLYMNDGQNMYEDWLAHQVEQRWGWGWGGGVGG